MRVTTIFTAICIAILAGSTSAGATDGPVHTAAGNAQLSDGVHLILGAVDGPDMAEGSFWLSTETGLESVRVTLDCVATEFHDTPYPIYPWLPYNSLHASGTTDDGTRYFLTVHDLGPAGAGHRDTAAVTQTEGAGPCGSPDSTEPLADGEITVAG